MSDILSVLLHFFNSYQMLYRTNHATNLRRIIVNDRSPQLSQPERLNGSLLRLFSIDRTSYLSYL
jgi:hypothetical protein